MTVLPISGARIGAQFRDAGRSAATGLAWLLFAAAWLLAKTLRLAVLAIGGLFFAAGWIGARAVWPALQWAGAAVKLGWQEGRKPLRAEVG